MDSRLSESDDSPAPAASDAANGIYTSEQAPLLHVTDPGTAADRSLRRRVIGMCAVFLFVIEASQVMMEPPTQEIMESIICRNHYPDHRVRNDERCKNTDVQKTLAMVRSWCMSAEMIIPLVVQVPYGIIADKFGRRTVLFLSLVGCVLQTAWTMVVLFLPNFFSIWALLYGNMAYAIGGGGQMASAMIWTILSDITPVAERTAVFYRIYALFLLLGVIANPMAALVLAIDPWFAMWLGFGILIIGALTALLIPETLRLRQRVDSERQEQDSLSQDTDCLAPVKAGRARQAWSALRSNAGHIWRFVCGSRRVTILICAYGLHFAGRINVYLNLLQYMTRRFSWEWSTAAYVSTVNNVTSVVVLLVVIPAASSILVKHCGYDAQLRDLVLSRASIILVVVGGYMQALAAVPWLFVLSLIITSLGGGFTPLCRALLSAIVEPHMVATLNTTLSTMETLVSLVGAPALGWLLSHGFELGGPWLGLPYLVTAGCSTLVLATVFAFGNPDESAKVPEERNSP
ncbi:major facilitator superfamily domain-containing protein [Hirsutella rhossiliensis]|uniref:Major facilitator superfamily domain-containing protein n=1 Tax=Hirsutella rhossiliensis TaxID=111463 RepID=A0A9P8SI41_9HYPO|nr:major facilitator superfamily domain-containing protein [Hirsutella rhossiliensis]KAH0963798.1 major facilitator superfamily domain-containing protein [Hirsutella rhossiliensis]